MLAPALSLGCLLPGSSAIPIIRAVRPGLLILHSSPWRCLRLLPPCFRPHGVHGETAEFSRPRFLLLAGLGLPRVWYGIQQGLMQRNTWPPMADPHHQAHWYVLSLLAFMILLVGAVGAWSGRGWRVATVTAGSASVAVAAASLGAPEAASALSPAWAVAAALWGLSMLGLTWHESRLRPLDV